MQSVYFLHKLKDLDNGVVNDRGIIELGLLREVEYSLGDSLLFYAANGQESMVFVG